MPNFQFIEYVQTIYTYDIEADDYDAAKDKFLKRLSESEYRSLTQHELVDLVWIDEQGNEHPYWLQEESSDE